MHRPSWPATRTPARRANSQRFRLLLIIVSASASLLHSGAFFHKHQQQQLLQDNGVHASFLDSYNGVSSFDCAKLDDFIVNRYEWEAQISTKRLERFPRKPRRVFVHHHTAHSLEEEPLAEQCQLDGSNCSAFLRRIQHEHQRENEWPDICYNFVLAPDGTIYEGLGGSVQGFHTANYNNESLGIALLGDYSRRTPTGRMQGAFLELLECLVELGQLEDEYALHGHRDARCTSCPGQAAYRQLQTMQHFEAGPLARYSCPSSSASASVSSSSSASSSVGGRRSNSQLQRRGRRFVAAEGRSPQLDKLSISKASSSDQAVILVNVPVANRTQSQALQPAFYLLTSDKTLKQPSSILITSSEPGSRSGSDSSSSPANSSSSSSSSSLSASSTSSGGPSGGSNQRSTGPSSGSSVGSGGSGGKSKSKQDKNQNQNEPANEDESEEFDGFF